MAARGAEPGPKGRAHISAGLSKPLDFPGKIAVPHARILRTECPMKFWIVANHDRGEYSLCPVGNEISARNVIASEQQKGRNVSYSISDATDRDAATREAETLYENYHNVENALRPD
jgi:hypothetical protein